MKRGKTSKERRRKLTKKNFERGKNFFRGRVIGASFREQKPIHSGAKGKRHRQIEAIASRRIARKLEACHPLVPFR